MLNRLEKTIRLWWVYAPYLWIGLIAGGWFGCSGPEPAGEPAARSESTDRAMPAFTDVTVEAGLGEFRHDNGAFGKMWYPEQMGAGGGFMDYDGDGWVDILLVGGGVWPGTTDRDVRGLWLYRNEGDGTFSLKTEEAGLGDISAYGIGIVAADYDNDGDQDFYFTTLRENMLFRNDGGVFTEVGKAARVAGEPIWSSSALFFDADRDSWLDLYVGNYTVWTPELDKWCSLDGVNKSYCPPDHYEGIPSSFYRNNGDGTFTDMTEAAGFLGAPGKSLGVAEMDFNQDGWSDFAVSNDGEGDLLYENNGDGTFTEKGMITGMAYGERGEARAGMGIDAGVVDNSGETSIFVGHFSNEMIGVFRYTRQGWFVDRAAVSKIGHASRLNLTFSVLLLDVDFDGDLDLLAANGHVYPFAAQVQEGLSYRQPAKLFLNRGDGTFEELDQAVGGVFAQPMVARGSAYADFDRDGDLDILFTENDGPAHLWRNDLKDAHFLRVRLEGRRSNRDGIGSRIVAVIGNQRMERRIRTGSGYLTQSEKIATFGLGAATRLDSLQVYWPSGQVARFVGVEANQEIRIVEGAQTYAREPLPRRREVAIARR